MKKFNIFAIAFLAVGLFSIAAFAQAASQSWSDIIAQLLSLVQSWKQVGIYAGIAALLKLVIDGLKVGGVWAKVSEKWQALAVAGVAALSVGLGSMAMGASVAQAVGAIFASAAGAMFVHELLKDLFGWGA